MISVVASLALLLQAPLSLAPAYSPDNDNGKLQDIVYRPNQIIPISAAPGYQVTVMLSPDERIRTIAVGDSSAWQVTTNKGGNNIFVKMSEAGLATNMTVMTNIRLYTFELVPMTGSVADMPYILRLNYPSVGTADETVNPGEVLGRYKVTGNKALRPSGIVDDGVRTFIEWPKSADLPAVYAIDQSGKEILVNGMMRQDRLVIESVATKLIFRIDKKVARASRREIERQP